MAIHSEFQQRIFSEPITLEAQEAALGPDMHPTFFLTEYAPGEYSARIGPFSQAIDFVQHDPMREAVENAVSIPPLSHGIPDMSRVELSQPEGHDALRLADIEPQLQALSELSHRIGTEILVAEGGHHTLGVIRVLNPHDIQLGLRGSPETETSISADRVHVTDVIRAGGCTAMLSVLDQYRGLAD
ncbi:MAG TPA: hypothetical protein VJP80_03835 [Candidatus Saccharimonadales bacterium]|nr:hypothetical protein [Candidatus Saccharimonadales bacterium]